MWMVVVREQDRVAGRMGDKESDRAGGVPPPLSPSETASVIVERWHGGESEYGIRGIIGRHGPGSDMSEDGCTPEHVGSREQCHKTWPE